MNTLKHALIVTALLTATALPSMGQMGGMGGMGGMMAARGGPRQSPHDAINTRVGGKLVTIYYGRPLSRDRVIWGTVVPWDKAWRLGADEATTLVLQSGIVIGGVTVPAGAYTLYMVPSQNGVSKLAISKTIGAWGIPVDETHDLARVDLKKEALDPQVDQLTLSLGRGSAANSGVLKIAWEKTQYSVEFTNAP